MAGNLAAGYVSRAAEVVKLLVIRYRRRTRVGVFDHRQLDFGGSAFVRLGAVEPGGGQNDDPGS